MGSRLRDEVKKHQAEERLKFLMAAFTADPIDSLKELVQVVQQGKVIDLVLARRLSRWRDGLEGDDLLASLITQMALIDQWFFVYFGCEALDFIDCCRPRGGRPRPEYCPSRPGSDSQPLLSSTQPEGPPLLRRCRTRSLDRGREPRAFRSPGPGAHPLPGVWPST